MSWTSVGFDGTITEIQWAGLAGLLGNGYVAAGNGDCLVTAVGGARSVSVAAGSLYGDGVLSTNSGAETVALTTPTNGQWYVVALRRTWATNTAALVAIAGATTTTSTPTVAPTSFPVLNTNVGVLTDQPIAWAWCNSANTTVVVFDIRLKAVKSMPPVVATSAERDAKFMSPTQGLQVWRDDLGAVETYYGLYNSSTNPGGRDIAGWYVNTRQTGLRPIQPSSVVIASGSGSANSLGVISFTGATAVSLNGVFSSDYRSYKIVFSEINPSSAGTVINSRMRAAGTDSTTTYDYHGARQFAGNAVSLYAGVNATAWDMGNYAGILSISMDIHNPFIATTTSAQVIGSQWVAGVGYGAGFSGYAHAVSTSYDGITFYPAAGTLGGTVQVFGYND